MSDKQTGPREVPTTPSGWVTESLRRLDRALVRLDGIDGMSREEHGLAVAAVVDGAVIALLMDALRTVSPAAAAAVAEGIGGLCEAGDSFEELAWEWEEARRADLDAHAPTWWMSKLGEEAPSE